MIVDQALSVTADATTRRARYAAVIAGIQAALEDEDDWVSAMATVACELHHAFDYYHWTGFYRAAAPEELRVGPYQGGHGCLRIPFSRGVCGAAARTRQTQRVFDVETFPGHIACSSTTRAEIVVPVISPAGSLLGVLDVDSDALGAFEEADQEALESLCDWLGARYGDAALR